MEKGELKFDYESYFCSVPTEYADLCEYARKMTRNAYSPYSGFSVGAAVLLENGAVVGGSNQENVAYPSGLCAERTALFAANSQYPDVKVAAIALAASKDGVFTDYSVSPCGACRQVMAEIVKRTGDFDVIMIGVQKTISIKASRLLPFAFDF